MHVRPPQSTISIRDMDWLHALIKGYGKEDSETSIASILRFLMLEDLKSRKLLSKDQAEKLGNVKNNKTSTMKQTQFKRMTLYMPVAIQDWLMPLLKEKAHPKSSFADYLWNLFVQHHANIIDPNHLAEWNNRFSSKKNLSHDELMARLFKEEASLSKRLKNIRKASILLTPKVKKKSVKKSA